MALKTFNLDENVYSAFSKHCKREGLSMSRKVENYIRAELLRIRCDVKSAIKDIEIPALAETIKETKLGARESRKENKEEHPLSKYC